MWSGMYPRQGELDDVCNVCALAKITKTPLPRVAETPAEEKLVRVFTDLMGPLKVESMSGLRLCIVFADQYSTRNLCLWTCLGHRVKHWPA